MKQVRGLESRQDYQEDRGDMPVVRGSTNVCVLVSLECHVCAFTSKLLSLPASEGEGDLAVYVLSPLCSALSVAVCVTAPCPSARAETPGPQAGLQQPGRRESWDRAAGKGSCS